MLQKNWLPSGISRPYEGLNDEKIRATILPITGGNFRLLHRLLTQIARLVEVNALSRGRGNMLGESVPQAP